MVKICVFAGTTEGRELVEFLCQQDAEIVACVATEYGETLLQPAENLQISAGRLDEAQMEALFLKGNFSLVIDATHPYASVVTENICAACEKTGTPYQRLLREGSFAPEDSTYVEDIQQAVAYLNQVEGNILLTTGSKELHKFAAVRDFANRVYARVLPMAESLQLCSEAGLPAAHILAMQGPFSMDMNTAMLRMVGASYMVTKESGKKGGFDEKVTAARRAGARLVVIGRPPQKQGLSLPQTVEMLCRKFQFLSRPKVTVVGIGPGSRQAMTGEVMDAISKADCVIGAKRMLEAVAEPGKPVSDAIAPADIAEFIETHPQYGKFAVVMSGDVGFFSGTKKLLPMLRGCDVQVLPGLSSFVYLCARLHVSYEDVVPVSLHGRDHDLALDIRENPRVFTLVGGENGLGKLCRHLVDAGLGCVRVSAGERLSYPDEKITTGTAEELASQEFSSLAVALIENEGAHPVVTHGLPDEAFRRGSGDYGAVPMTKSEVRSVCLSKLRLRDDSVCWDVGAGTGSVAIEMALQAKRGQVFAIEKKEAALGLLQENKGKFSLSNLEIVAGSAPEACEVLPAPTHAFIGGSSGNLKEIIALLLQKNPNVRIVATAIALESVAELTACLKSFPFTETEVVSMTVARDRKAGSYHLMTGQNPIYIVTMQGGSL